MRKLVSRNRINWGQTFDAYKREIARKVSETFDVDFKYALKVFESDLDDSQIKGDEEWYLFVLEDGLNENPRLRKPKEMMFDYDSEDGDYFRAIVNSDYDEDSDFVIWTVKIINKAFM